MGFKPGENYPQHGLPGENYPQHGLPGERAELFKVLSYWGIGVLSEDKEEVAILPSQYYCSCCQSIRGFPAFDPINLNDD